MIRKRANKASYTIEKVTWFACLYQLYIQLHHVISDDLDIFCPNLYISVKILDSILHLTIYNVIILRAR